ncbi:hypothetical protein G7047_11010 [Diaphorobacter sp. HDW4A]|uniref:hypothetical protein n=1 Tax=Diaphorobacter sp. HDW4A TaxID=2714924 RepID=UPI00140AFFDE|nr:hypothetical protein [Diaphorobacter sp. HDW4A]QIL80372.1 hypothetical protein G7047_11010 [Diaphorobacter sp. HDW4A]
MFDSFVVVLRELAELILIIYALVAALRAGHGGRLIPWVAAGTLAGLGLAAVVCGWLLSGTVDPRWTAGLTLALALGVIVMACTLLATARAIQERVQGFVERYAGMAVAPFVVFVFALIAALREGLEAGLFLRMVARMGDAPDAVIGALLAIVCAALLTAASRRIGVRVGALAAFRGSALLLSLLAIQMVLGSVQEVLHAPGIDPALGLALAPILPDGVWYAWTCTALMLIPMLYLLKGWWSGAGRTGA